MKLQYRAEIDGLRTIAVLSVILYHAKFYIHDNILFKGGYLGVDVFFVISGYLITSIILNELNIKKNFNFKNFYDRRVRRIIPALITVIIFSTPFAWLYLLPEAFVEYSKSILSSLFFISNFFFLFIGQIYGAESSLLKPFLHTWSLSIEEQFYILYPIFLYLIFKYFKKYLFPLLIIFFVVSLFLAEWLSYWRPHLNFYILPTRIWELMSGAILAYLNIFKINMKIKKNTQNFLSFFALVTLISSIFLFTENTKHPSILSLLPVISTCILIMFQNKELIVNKFLSNKILVKIGLISYSLYLWHYPIFSFARIKGLDEQEIIIKTLLIFITFLLSFLTYEFIEKPARIKKYKMM